MPKRKKELIRDAAQAHSDLNIFYGVVGLLEGGTVSSDAHPDDCKIINMAKRAAQRCLRRYDRALAALLPNEQGKPRCRSNQMGDDLDGLPPSGLGGIVFCILGLCLGALLLGMMAAR